MAGSTGLRRLEDMTEPELAELMRTMARAVEAAAANLGVERPLFALVAFNDPASAQYIGNCERSDMIRAMRETADRLQRKLDIPRDGR